MDQIRRGFARFAQLKYPDASVPFVFYMVHIRVMGRVKNRFVENSDTGTIFRPTLRATAKHVGTTAGDPATRCRPDFRTCAGSRYLLRQFRCNAHHSTFLTVLMG